MKAGLEPAHRSQIEGEEIEEQRAIRLGGEGDHFPLLILSGVIVDPLQVRGLSAQTGTVVHELAIDFARRKINERHVSLTRVQPQTYSIRATHRPTFMPIFVACCALRLRPISKNRGSLLSFSGGSIVVFYDTFAVPFFSMN